MKPSKFYFVEFVIYRTFGLNPMLSHPWINGACYGSFLGFRRTMVLVRSPHILAQVFAESTRDFPLYVGNDVTLASCRRSHG